MKTLAILCLVVAAAVGAGACAPTEPVVVREYPTYYALPDPPAQPRPAKERRSRVPAMAGAGLLGAVVGGWLGAAACDDLNDTDEECSDRAIEGALLGGGVGVLIGAVVGE